VRVHDLDADDAADAVDGPADHRGTVNRHSISRTVYRIGRIVGVEVVHPHRPGTPWPPR